MSETTQFNLGKVLEDKTLLATIFYTEDNSIGIKCFTSRFLLSNSGRIVLPNSFKQGKSIMLICEGAVKVLNRYGDRLGVHHEHEYGNLSEVTNL